MITYVESNLFTSPAQTLVNTVNTVGVMGKGLAKAFKDYFPEMFAEYRRLCEDGEIAPGRLMLFRTPHKWVLNFPTKRHWRQPSRVHDLEAGLRTFCQTYADQGIVSASFPQLGCGNGGLDWERQVRPLMERYLGYLPVEIYVHIARKDRYDDSDIDRDQLQRWLRGTPPCPSFQAFRRDLFAAVASGDATSWRADDDGETLYLTNPKFQFASERLDLFELWRRLRTFGFVAPEDVPSLTAIPAELLFSLLALLPYVNRTPIVQTSSHVLYDVGSTQFMLDDPRALGVQLVLPRLADCPEKALSHNHEDISWSENRMTSQLALFSTS
jgi:O-acetyl-ADP-ribose deacetylase (regulator of RNase III)